MSIRAHKKAILDRLRADPLLANAVYEGVVANPPQFYVTVFTNSGVRSSDRFTGPQSVQTFSYTVHSIATTSDQAQLVAEHVFAQLLDYTPTVTGRVCRRLQHITSRPTQQDPDVTPALWFQADQFDLISEPSS